MDKLGRIAPQSVLCLGHDWDMMFGGGGLNASPAVNQQSQAQPVVRICSFFGERQCILRSNLDMTLMLGVEDQMNLQLDVGFG